MSVVVRIGNTLVMIEQVGRKYRIQDFSKYHWLGWSLMGYDGFGQWRFFTGSQRVPQYLLDLEQDISDAIKSLRGGR